MLSSQLRSAGRRLPRITAKLHRITAFGLFAAITLHAAAAGDRTIKTRVAPLYPDLANRMRIAATVVGEAVVGPEGKVIDVKALSGSKVLSYAAEEAVRKWTFVPAPEKSTGTVDIKFALAE